MCDPLKLSYLFIYFRIGFFIYIYKFIYLFIFILGCVGSLLLRAGFLQLQRAGATLRCGAWASHCGGFSCCGTPALGSWASVVLARGLSSCGSQALERRLSSCGSRAQLLRGMWDLPRPGLKPLSPGLASGFLTTVPSGKSQVFYFKTVILFQDRFTDRYINYRFLKFNRIVNILNCMVFVI